MRSSGSKIMLRSLFISYLLSAVLLLLLALLLYKLNLSESQTGIAVYAVYAIACLAGGFLSGRSAGSRRFFWGLLSGTAYGALLLLLSVLFRHGIFPDLHHLMTVMGCCMTCGILGGILS